jgi:hypothetical protein
VDIVLCQEHGTRPMIRSVDWQDHVSTRDQLSLQHSRGCLVD